MMAMQIPETNTPLQSFGRQKVATQHTEKFVEVSKADGINVGWLTSIALEGSRNNTQMQHEVAT